MIRVAIAVSVVAACAAAPSFAQTILKREPPMGALTDGQIVLVDNGRCPKGQIQQVTGGNHVKAGGTKQIVRTYACVPRP